MNVRVGRVTTGWSPCPDMTCGMVQRARGSPPLTPRPFFEAGAESVEGGASGRAGFSGAQLSNLVNEAALAAAKANQPLLTPTLLEHAQVAALCSPAPNHPIRSMPQSSSGRECLLPSMAVGGQIIRSVRDEGGGM